MTTNSSYVTVGLCCTVTVTISNVIVIKNDCNNLVQYKNSPTLINNSLWGFGDRQTIQHTTSGSCLTTDNISWVTSADQSPLSQSVVEGRSVSLVSWTVSDDKLKQHQRESIWVHPIHASSIISTFTFQQQNESNQPTGVIIKPTVDNCRLLLHTTSDASIYWKYWNIGSISIECIIWSCHRQKYQIFWYTGIEFLIYYLAEFSHVMQRSCEIFVETFPEFSSWKKLLKFYITT